MVRRLGIDRDGGKHATAPGDVHVTVDRLMARGANVGSYSALVPADVIAEAESRSATGRRVPSS
jgi:hypothetical protein